jgi:hypothetical protein
MIADYITKKDLAQAFDNFETRFLPRVEKMVARVVGEVVGEIVGDALQLTSERFDRLEARMDHMEERMDRVEDKLDRSIARIDVHDVDIRELKRKPRAA